MPKYILRVTKQVSLVVRETEVDCPTDAAARLALAKFEVELAEQGVDMVSGGLEAEVSVAGGTEPVARKDPKYGSPF